MAFSRGWLWFFWVESVMLSNTLVGRDKSMRGWQYFARMMSGLTGKEIFMTILKTMSLSRKTLRFYKPVKSAKAFYETVTNPIMDDFDRNTTLVEVASDGTYALLDHVAFFQRIGALPWMTPRQTDMWDRFLEFFWFTEVVPVIIREVRHYYKLREKPGRKTRKPTLGRPSSSGRITRSMSIGEGSGISPVRGTSEALLAPMVSYPSSASLVGDFPDQQEDDKDLIVAKRKHNLILLFKAIICDLPCTLYFMQNADFRNAGRNKAWAGFLGMIASGISLHINWPNERPKIDNRKMA